jgi:trans-aconitate 2-methyltransferase
VQGSFESWSPDRPVDLIFTNAALQWAGGHESLFPRLVQSLAPGGVFACQVPLSHSAGWYDLLRETIAEPQWAAQLQDVRGTQPIAPADAYYGWLAPYCSSVDIWSTIYLHVLTGDDPVVEWMKGTGLRPYLQAFSSETERDLFLAAYRARVSRAFPQRPDGTTLFPFPRLFVLARRA